MSLNPKQFEFVRLVGLFIQYAYLSGYTLTFGDARAKDGHKKNSFHYKGLAIDFNVFKDNVYLTETEDMEELGIMWKSLDKNCTWGGDFRDKYGNRDGNHFSYGEF